MNLRRAASAAITHGLAAVVDTLAGLADGQPPGTDVLVVRLDAIGDFLLWSDAARRLAEHYRGEGRRVVLLANAAWAGLAADLDAFDAVWGLDRRRFLLHPAYRLALLRRIRRAGFGLAVQPTFSRELLLGDAVVRASGAHMHIGFAGDLANRRGWQRWLGDRWYGRLVPATPWPLHELERNAEFLHGLGIAATPAIGRLPGLPPREPGLGDAFVLFPGAGWDGRRWPPAAFAALAGRIAAATGWRGIVAGGPGDRQMAAELCAAAPIPLDNRTGRSTLAELAVLLRDARLLVANETSAVHLAAMVGTPSVCITGGGHFGRFVPYTPSVSGPGPRPVVVHHAMDCYGCNWSCRHPRRPDAPVACIAAVSVDQVWAAVAPLLAFHPNP